MTIDDLDENENGYNEIKQEKKNTCLLIRVIILLVMMLPSSIAFLAVF